MNELATLADVYLASPQCSERTDYIVQVNLHRQSILKMTDPCWYRFNKVHMFTYYSEIISMQLLQCLYCCNSCSVLF